MLEASQQASIAEGRHQARYYRPELDVLRFFAFFCVFIGHGPDWNVGPVPRAWERDALVAFYMVKQVGAFGLSIFFLLSSFLITELLSREFIATRTIHLKAFYTRRILRIWPLYYLGVCMGIIVGFLPGGVRLTTDQILYLICFVGWFGRGTYHNGVGILWSISVEELFYLIWPSVGKFGGIRSIVWMSVILIPISLFIGTRSLDWYNPLIQFLFFALGALLAVSLHNRSFQLSTVVRVVLFLAALPGWWVAAGRIGGYRGPLTRLEMAETFPLIAWGCVLIFLSIYDLPARLCPQPLIYLGKISYGLYVFHHICLIVSARLLSQMLGTQVELLRIPLTYIAGFVATTVLASISYKYFEKPFLRLKERFAFIPSRRT